MHLYKVLIEMPVLHGTYYVVASGFDEAADMAMAVDTAHGARNGGVLSIEVIGHVGDDEANLILSPDAASLMLGPHMPA